MSKNLAAKTFTEAVEALEKNATWLDETDEIMVIALYRCAESLDKRMSAGVLTQFGLMARALLKKAPDSAYGDDPLEALLADE